MNPESIKTSPEQLTANELAFRVSSLLAELAESSGEKTSFSYTDPNNEGQGFLKQSSKLLAQNPETKVFWDINFTEVSQGGEMKESYLSLVAHHLHDKKIINSQDLLSRSYFFNLINGDFSIEKTIAGSNGANRTTEIIEEPLQFNCLYNLYLAIDSVDIIKTEAAKIVRANILAGEGVNLKKINKIISNSSSPRSSKLSGILSRFFIENSSKKLD